MFKVLFLTTFLILGIRFSSHSQSSCEILATTKITNTQPGRKAGQIAIQIDDDKADRFKVFLLNQGVEQAKKELKDRKVSDLGEGLYEFIIVDTKRERCFKELSVRISEAN
jgi:hypothetical protein